MTSESNTVKELLESQDVIHTTSVLIWLSDSNGACTSFNQNWLNYTGLELNEAISKGGLEPIIHEDDLSSFQKRYQASINKQEPVSLEIRLCRYDDEYHWFKCEVTPYYCEEGKCLGYIGNCLNIDDVKKEHADLVELNQRLELAIEGSSDGLWDWPDITKDEEWWSPKQYELLGYKDKEVPASYSLFKELIHPDDFDIVMDEVERSLNKNDFYDVQFRMKTKSGEYKWFRSKAMVAKDKNGKAYRMTGSIRDINEIRLARLELEASETHYRENYNKTPVMLHSINRDGEIINVSDYWLKVMGYDREEVIGHMPFEFLSEESRQYAKEYALPTLLKQGHIEDVPYEFVKKDKTIINVLLSAIAEKDFDDNIICYRAVIIDVTDKRRSEEKLRQSEERFQLAVAGSSDGLWDWDITANTCWYSPHFKNMLGYSEDEFENVFDSFVRVIHSDDHDNVLNSIENHKKNAEPCDVECRIKHENGNFYWYLMRGQALWNKDNKAIRMSGSLKYIHKRKLVEQALALEKEKAIVTLTSIGDAVITTDTKGIVEFINPVAEKLTGFRSDDAKGKLLSQVFCIKDEVSREEISNPVQRCLEQGRIIGLANHTILINRDGTESSIEDSAAPIRNDKGEILGVVLVFKDVTENRRMAREMSYQASHDHLTGLVNRREFERRLKRIINTAQEEGSKHATCYLDLDQFKVINDTCGHTAGDELLRHLSILLKKAVRTRDTVGRLGGDEFGIIMEHCDLKQARKVCEKVLKVIDDFRFVWENKSFSIGTSIGLVPITMASDSVTGILRSADAACYTAKDKGRNRIHVYDESDEQLSKRHGEMQWVSKINKALEDDRFLLYGQLIQSADRRRKTRLIEVLIRMQDKKDGVIAPGLFLPAAERYGLSTKIDRWVIRSFMKWYAKNKKKIDAKDIWCINLSGLSLGDDEFLSYVVQNIKNHHVPASNLCFEITETAAIANLTSANRFVTTLKKMGCTFSLDDFGSGLSSFAYLKNLPVDYLKIDGLFVKDMVDDPIDHAMVKSINEIGHVMGKKTIAEFVENDEIIKKLKTVKTDFLQGYGIHKPDPIDHILKL